MIELLDDVADCLELADGWLGGVRRAQRLRSGLADRFQRLMRHACFIGGTFSFGQFGRHLLLVLLSQIEHLLQAEFERAHDDLLVVDSIWAAIETSARRDASNGEMSSGSCCR